MKKNTRPMRISPELEDLINQMYNENPLGLSKTQITKIIAIKYKEMKSKKPKEKNQFDMNYLKW